MTPTDLQALTDDDLNVLRVNVLAEQERRIRLLSTPDRLAEMSRAYVADGGDLAHLVECVQTSTDPDPLDVIGA